MHKQKERLQSQQNRMRMKLAEKKGSKTICLTMIVKNESKNMNRLLDSLCSIIDMISIVDTGSTDNTKEVITNWAKKQAIPCKLHDKLFKNFSYNRTHSVIKAQESYPNADYLLLSDADFIWKCVDIFTKNFLVDHLYMVKQISGIEYWNTRILNAKIDWECVGVTHEYWQAKAVQSKYQGEIRTSKVNSILIQDIGDGGCKEDKFERDKKLLTEGLNSENTPKDLKTRYKFYLAQTYKDCKEFDTSIFYYKKRIEDGGWFEEVFFSYYQIGFCYENKAWAFFKLEKILQKNENHRNEEEKEYILKYPSEISIEEVITTYKNLFEEADKWYILSYKYRNVRLEGLYNAVRLKRVLGFHQEAFDRIKMAPTNITYPKEDNLFLTPECYSYLFDFERHIVCFYLKDMKHIGREATERLLEKRDEIKQEYMNIIEANLKYYL